MPSTLDISPTVGHAVLATQLGVGSSPGYDAIDLRRSFAHLQEGVFGSGDWKVTESTPNAMTVDVAANTGRAMVQGDTIGNQGLYVVAPHSAAALGMTIGANASGNPRIDQIVLEVFDTTHDGSGSNKATIAVLQGTPTAGATLDNRTGAAALPNTALRLADVLVASGAATITNASIRDRRTWARGARWRGKATSGDVTLTLAGAEILTGSLKARLECSGGLVLVEFAAIGQSTGGSAPSVTIGPWVDGTWPDDPLASAAGAPNTLLTYYTGTSGFNFSANFAFLLDPGAGSHLFSVWASRVVSATLFASNTSSPAIYSVTELIGSSANNGTT